MIGCFRTDARSQMDIHFRKLFRVFNFSNSETIDVKDIIATFYVLAMHYDIKTQPLKVIDALIAIYANKDNIISFENVKRAFLIPVITIEEEERIKSMLIKVLPKCRTITKSLLLK